MNLQSQVVYVHKKKFKQRICILQDGASGEHVGDIDKIIVQNLFEI
jgi:hypothetical protein